MKGTDGTKVLDSSAAVISERSNEKSSVHKTKRRRNKDKTFDNVNKVDMGDRSKSGMNFTDRDDQIRTHEKQYLYENYIDFGDGAISEIKKHLYTNDEAGNDKTNERSLHINNSKSKLSRSK